MGLYMDSLMDVCATNCFNKPCNDQLMLKAEATSKFCKQWTETNIMRDKTIALSAQAGMTIIVLK